MRLRGALSVCRSVFSPWFSVVVFPICASAKTSGWASLVTITFLGLMGRKVIGHPLRRTDGLTV